MTTVSPNYLNELKNQSNGMESLIYHEQHKSLGILNGIDTQVWDPKKDPFIAESLKRQINSFKDKNKTILAQRFHVDPQLPLVTFIGRLVREKGADLLPDLIRKVSYSGMQVAFAVLGTGDPRIQEALRHLSYELKGRFDAALEYNEALAHQLYAGSDFLLMPSRVEPCGLNQMYAMRYGTIPVVRTIGGLKDTVPDIGEPDGSGRGIRFNQFNLDDAYMAIYRAVELYHNKKYFDALRKSVSKIDFSWENSANNYLTIYKEMS